jgi:hypothetical protein
MLAYVFWHRAQEGVDPVAYEESLRAFHASLDSASASFRLERLPFGQTTGYEDWYLVEDWSELGELNSRAIDARHRPQHDRAASGTATGWGGIYELLRGDSGIPEGTEWFDKPLGEPTDAFLTTRPEATIWRRQLVLGPAPEFCAAAPPSPARKPL